MGTGIEGRSSNTFPMYLMLIGRRRKFLSIQDAGKAYDSGHVTVNIGNLVLESDFSVRDITAEEALRIGKIADEYSASK